MCENKLTASLGVSTPGILSGILFGESLRYSLQIRSGGHYIDSLQDSVGMGTPATPRHSSHSKDVLREYLQDFLG